MRAAELYVQNDRSLNAMAIGMKQPFIVVNTGMVETADDDELRCLLGHELGMCCPYVVYRTMILVLTNMMVRLAWFPLGPAAVRDHCGAVQWWRKAELSADRTARLPRPRRLVAVVDEAGRRR